MTSTTMTTTTLAIVPEDEEPHFVDVFWLAQKNTNEEKRRVTCLRRAGARLDIHISH